MLLSIRYFSYDKYEIHVFNERTSVETGENKKNTETSFKTT